MSNLIRYRVVNKSNNWDYGDYFTVGPCKAKITKLTRSTSWSPGQYKKEDFEIIEYEMVERRRVNSTNNFVFDEKDVPQVEKSKDIWD